MGRLARMRNESRNLRARFDAEVQVLIYNDRMEGSGRCRNCSNQVTQVLRFSSLSDRFQLTSSPAFQNSFVRVLCRLMVRNHPCRFAQNGKDDVAAFLDRFVNRAVLRGKTLGDNAPLPGVKVEHAPEDPLPPLLGGPEPAPEAKP